MTDSDKMINSIQASGGLNILLWLASFGVGGVAVWWVLFGGPASEARSRADTIQQLWPIATAWMTGLAAKSKITGDQKREVVRSSALLKAASIGSVERSGSVT